MPTTSHRLGSSSSSRGREFRACSWAYRTDSSVSRSRPKCLRALACSLGDMGPLAHRCTYRVGTAIDPLRGSTFHQRAERLLIQSHRDGHSRPLPDRRAARTRGCQLGQVITTLSLISPRLNLLIADGVSMKKTLTHRNIVYEILALHYRMHNGISTRKPPSPHARGRREPSRQLWAGCPGRSRSYRRPPR